MKKIIAVLGVGLMGAPYAEILIADGHDVRLYNRTRAKAEEISGATVCDSPEQAAQGAEVVISLLANDLVALDTVREETLQGMAADGVHLSCSTLSVTATTELAQRAKNVGRDHLTCPFLGRPEVVAQRAHQFLLSGQSRKRDEVLDLLRSTCQGVTDFGESPEAAAIAKLSTNFLITSAIVSMSESFALLEKAGIDKQKAYDVWTTSLFNCPAYKAYGEKVMQGQHQEPSFRLDLGLKDVTLVSQAAESLDTSHDVMSAVRERFAKSVAAGDEGLDFTGVSRLIREQSGL